MIKKLMRSIREYKKASLLTPLFVVIEVILEILIPLIMAQMIDIGITGKNITVLKQLGIVLIVCVALGLLFGILSGSYCAVAKSGPSGLRKTR